VSGHVDGVGTILKKDKVQRSWFFRIGVNNLLARHIIEKGSIAVDGVSLTINRCHEDFFEVNIIPETARNTIINNKKVGDLVNIETDLIAKYIEKFIKTEDASVGKKASPGIDKEMLIKYGFGE
jgi:riboflavin synthase